MKTLLADFGTDHWYQLDGYFNGGTAPWLDSRSDAAALAGITTLANAPSLNREDQFAAAAALAAAPPPAVVADPAWYARGTAAYTGLNRTDPDAVWSYQGFAVVGWDTPEKASWLKGFVDAVPKDKFNVIDMGYSGIGEWQKWNDSSFFDAQFIWTALMNFGGTNGIKGNMTHMNEIPFTALNAGASVWGSGITSEGTVRVFRQKFTLEDAIGSHACSLEANMRVTNGIPLRRPLSYQLTP
jgi:hypothetical protein